MLLNQKSPHGGDIYSHDVTLDFSSNLNPFGTPQAVKEAVKRSAEHCAVYPDPCCRRLREAIAAYEGTAPEHILCGNGAAELIYAYAYTLDGDCPALIVSPTFCEYETALCAAGVSAEHYTLSKDNGFFLTEEILRVGLSRFSAVFLCTPNNPTGVTAAPELLYEIAKTGVRVFADMCFLEMTEEPDRYDIPRLIEAYPNVTVLRALTKSYAMAGVRLGYALCSDGGFLSRMSQKTQCWNVSLIAQEAGLAALDCRTWLGRSVKQISEERRRMTAILRSLGVTVYPSEANFLLLNTTADLYGVLQRRGVLVRDCSDYVGLSEGFFRIAVRTPAENDRLLSVIKEVTR